ncbi:hypothetical protein ACFORJ_00615 [Corynebacterium hansenii]|uniref:DUF393 domain-containing protein n=1 Tax=Corynebacterium hansenii TaxID=394964 RepID=A0ABV7ZMF1_9CORY|nr:hypothetical protein [Corynebacterium hansenii]WJY99498.1 hypothetical protein CHAN_04375 [Corynebacterium hansenii]
MSPQFPARAAATFVYDGGCGFCARAARALGRITVAGAPGPRSLDDVPAPSLNIASSWDYPFEEVGVDAALIERNALYVEERDVTAGASTGATGARTGAENDTAHAPPFVALGHEAIGHALRDHGRTRRWRLAGSILLNPLVRAPASIVYRLIANNRVAASRVTEAVVKRTRRR